MIETSLQGSVLEILIANPPVNALGAGVRKGLERALREAILDSAVKAIVVRGTGKFFSAGADISEFDNTIPDPQLPDIINLMETSPKPVVAAIHGLAFGGGLELALGAHYRIATPIAKLGLPEVALGILPGAGGTQRLPRIVGVEAALEMIVSGAPISAAKGAEIGLIDKLAENEDLAQQATAYARTLTAPRPTGAREVTADPAVFEQFATKNARKIDGLDAPKACIEAVRAAVILPLAQGLERELAFFHELVVGQQSEALRHVFFSERMAAKIDDLPKETTPRKIAKVGIIGAGTMGGGISMNFLSAGIPVTIVDMAQEALDRGIAVICRNYEATAAKGRLTTEQVGTAMTLLTSSLDFGELADCDLIIEAVYEDMDIKKRIFARLDEIAKPGAILASNTSYLSIDDIADVTSRPGDVVGLHFFSPANIMKLVEVVRGAKTAADVLATAMDLARRIGKQPVVSGVCYGFIGNRMLLPRIDGAIDMLVEGATPQQVDRISVDLGMPMGPLQMMDLAGLDLGWHRDVSRIESVRDALCAAGRWGQKTGCGIYDYDDKRRPLPSPAAQSIIDAFREKSGIVPRAISDEEITARTLYVMVNEGAKILEEGITQRASDIDVVWLNGYAWPRHTGGPMYWAEHLVGLEAVVQNLNAYSRSMGESFSLSPLLVRAATNRTSFEDARGKLGAGS
ncbi:3-hydroxyacyl-CoA dehydrogenase [Sphingomonas sp. Root710]|uniref:3-hydroxyacyl-CoA dehydrogenase NAD-binding domain-containing protein n=1 Tax=Sphingomonas sp. Root710 TaxID=1736594 RepID=UPI000700110B|nr:3-hydroxyacyl-CoA dehydrogenase NAD-binding domain-containing protein [Sphingomonas sp. Root710]KRB86744.1 3-hydroxyacyl-CoA dehydrogenase [Sphingomonas sp. Root710]